MPQCSHSDCTATHTTPGGLTNIAAYSGGKGEQWLCYAHLPEDFRKIRESSNHLRPDELLAIHGYVAKNYERISTAAGRQAPKTSD